MKKLLMVKSFNTKVILLSSNNEYIDNYNKYGNSYVILEPIDEDTWKDEKIHKNYLQIVKYSVLLICSLNFVIGTSYHN